MPSNNKHQRKHEHNTLSTKHILSRTTNASTRPNHSRSATARVSHPAQTLGRSKHNLQQQQYQEQEREERRNRRQLYFDHGLLKSPCVRGLIFRISQTQAAPGLDSNLAPSLRPSARSAQSGRHCRASDGRPSTPESNPLCIAEYGSRRTCPSNGWRHSTSTSTAERLPRACFSFGA